MTGSAPGGAVRWTLPSVLPSVLPGVVAAGVSAGAGTVVGAGLRRAAPASLDRTAHVGRPVTLAAGPAVAVGLVLAVAVAGPVRALPAVLAAAVAGLVDDLAGTGSGSPDAVDTPAGTAAGPTAAIRGLAGHLGALSTGRVTTGTLKVAVIGVGAVVTAALLGRATRASGWRLVADGAVVAGTANLVNLLDLRPGRAGKVAGAAALALVRPVCGRPAAGGVPLAAAVLGAVAAELPRDLAGEWMLGDCGANALGAALGASVVAGRGTRVRTIWLVVVLALTVLSERVSLSAVVDRRPVLAWLDRLGRRGPTVRASDGASTPGSTS